MVLKHRTSQFISSSPSLPKTCLAQFSQRFIFAEKLLKQTILVSWPYRDECRQQDSDCALSGTVVLPRAAVQCPDWAAAAAHTVGWGPAPSGHHHRGESLLWLHHLSSTESQVKTHYRTSVLSESRWLFWSNKHRRLIRYLSYTTG